MADDGDFVTLNVGGTKFVSTKSTLCTKGSKEPSHYFTALLGGKFGALKDADGAVMIDRSPEKFRVILEYLRTGFLEIPDSVSAASLIVEGEYYCLDSFVEAVHKEVEASQNTERQLVVPTKLRLDGCYVHSQGAECIAFRSEGRLVRAISTHPERKDCVAQLLTFVHAFPIPEFWSSGKGAENIAIALAQHATHTASRGTYKQQDQYLLLNLENFKGVKCGLLAYGDRLLLIDPAGGQLQATQEYTFQPW